MFEKFDKEARQVIVKAHELAVCGGFKSIRPAHIAIAASIVLKMVPQTHQMPFSPSASLMLSQLNLDNITAEDLYEEFKGR